MRHARRRIVRRATRLAAVGGVILGGLMVTQAVATEPPQTTNLPLSSAQAAGTTGSGLVSELGTERTAGSWIADDGKPVVAVTDEEAAAEVKKAGARPKVVDYSMDTLKSATETLRSAPRVAGTAWSVDYTKNEVYIQRITFIPSATILAWSIVVLAIGLLLFTEVEPFFGGMVLVAVLSFIMVYVLLLIEVIKTPFHDEGKTKDDVSLFLLERTLRNIKDS